MLEAALESPDYPVGLFSVAVRQVNYVRIYIILTH